MKKKGATKVSLTARCAACWAESPDVSDTTLAGCLAKLRAIGWAVVVPEGELPIYWCPREQE